MNPYAGYIIMFFAIVLMICMILFSLMLKHAQRRLKKNEKKLIQLYKEYIVFLRIYRNILLKTKQGRPLDYNDLEWCRVFAEKH